MWLDDASGIEMFRVDESENFYSCSMLFDINQPCFDALGIVYLYRDVHRIFYLCLGIFFTKKAQKISPVNFDGIMTQKSSFDP